MKVSFVNNQRNRVFIFVSVKTTKKEKELYFACEKCYNHYE